MYTNTMTTQYASPSQNTQLRSCSNRSEPRSLKLCCCCCIIGSDSFFSRRSRASSRHPPGERWWYRRWYRRCLQLCAALASPGGYGSSPWHLHDPRLKSWSSRSFHHPSFCVRPSRRTSPSSRARPQSEAAQGRVGHILQQWWSALSIAERPRLPSCGPRAPNP